VLAVAIFVAFWVVLAFGLFFIASRGGLGGARATVQTQTRGANRLVGIVFTFMLLGFGIALPAALLIGNHDNANRQVGGYKLTAGERTGRELFGAHCAVCHTLAAANAIGKVGPNLDTLKAAGLTGPAHDQQWLPAQRSSGSAEQCLGEGSCPPTSSRAATPRTSRTSSRKWRAGNRPASSGQGIGRRETGVRGRW